MTQLTILLASKLNFSSLLFSRAKFFLCIHFFEAITATVGRFKNRRSNCLFHVLILRRTKVGNNKINKEVFFFGLLLSESVSRRSSKTNKKSRCSRIRKQRLFEFVKKVCQKTLCPDIVNLWPLTDVPLFLFARTTLHNKHHSGRFSDSYPTFSAPSRPKWTVRRCWEDLWLSTTDTHSGATVTDFHRVPIWLYSRIIPAEPKNVLFTIIKERREQYTDRPHPARDFSVKIS